MHVIIGLILGVTASLGGVLWWRHILRQRRTQESRTEATKIERAAHKQAEQIERDSEIAVRREDLILRQNAEQDFDQLETEIARKQLEIADVEERVAIYEQEVAEKVAAYRRRFQAAERTKQVNRKKRKEAQALHRKAMVLLEERAGTDREQITAKMAEGLVAGFKASWADKLRNLDSDLAPDIEKLAKRIVGVSIGRYLALPALPRTNSTLSLSEMDAKWAMEDGAGVLAELEQTSQAGLTLSLEDRTIKVDSSDGVLRELVRRVLEVILAKSPTRRSAGDVRSVFENKKREMDREIRKLGLEAFKVLGQPPSGNEVVDLVGRLAFRTSYSQNQYHHSIEAATIAGLMAAELGLDEAVAQRGTLLHDIGKALTHEVEGSHALIGAEIAARNGEAEPVVNAIAAHHDDVEPTSIYAALVAAADAISGARPGARRELLDAYVDRIQDIERMVRSIRGVSQAYAMQAGRELRIMVDEKRVDDERAAQLAAEIAQRISNEVIIPGQVKVTVIRETSAQAVAR